jgi:hypothetical protein
MIRLADHAYMKRILIEGYTYQVNPSFTYVDILIKHLINNDFEVDVLLNAFSIDKRFKHLQRSLENMGVTKVIFIKDNYFNLVYLIKSVFRLLGVFIKKNRMIEYSINGIKFGDGLYDGILRYFKELTIEKLSIRDYFQWYIAILDYYSSRNAIQKDYDSLYVSHLVYSKFVILARLFWYQKKPVFLMNTTGLLIYRNHANLLFAHNREYSKFEVISNIEDKEYTSKIDKYLNERISGKVQHFDVVNSYKNKDDEIDPTKFRGKLKDRYVVLVAAHAFKDAPHDSNLTMFRDYYDWFTYTLKYISEHCNSNLVYLIKPHPSAMKYNEEVVVEKLFNETFNSRHTNVFLIEPSLNTKALIDFVDLTVTCSGTIGIEFACFGIPTLVVGKPFYSGWGFSVEPSNLSEYDSLLSDPLKISKLSMTQINIAKSLFYEHVTTTQFLIHPFLTGNVLNLSENDIIKIKSYIDRSSNE